ncbi:hypothetical protein ACTQ45_01055 [Fundicoccus sp. Sow4_D5]|uniref:hypothetical protein n=1 Tax=Fundicoccus sp. Sow4_D5 TaxID=3438782 RepID=UPI003F8FD44B
MDINSILAAAGPAIAWTFDKVFDIYEMVEYTKPNGADGKQLQATKLNEPCRVSLDKRPVSQKGEGNLDNSSLILFCGPDVNVPIGSKLMVRNGDHREKYQSTEKPMKYPSHQEIRVNKHEWI